jgi:hypothetical protein
MASKCKIPPVSYAILTAVLFSAVALTSSCGIYSFSGASIDYARVKTVSVQYFQNRASIVQPGLSQVMTDALIDKCKAQTKLEIVGGIGDVNFEGEIIDYNTRPLTVAADNLAAMNRFTITINVKYTNSVQPEFNFEKRFSQYQDYDSNLDLSQVEQNLVDIIIKLIVEEIFNAAFVNW